jgi:uncharacterized membrane protein YccC
MATPGSKLSRPTAAWWNPTWVKITWSVPAAMRAVRATIVIPSLFAITSKVIGDPQVALFATFGGFATLIVTGFDGTRKDKLTGHLGLAVVGTVMVVIGTLVSGTPWLAALVTVPVAFVVFFAGVLGPVPAAAGTGLLFAYVLPVASAGGASTIGSRLAGWWLAVAAGTVAVLLVSPKNSRDRVRAAASALAREIAIAVRRASDGETTDPAAMMAAKDGLRAAFTSAPYRPTGLATADQALASVVQLLAWGAAQTAKAFDGRLDMAPLSPRGTTERELLGITASMFEDVAALLAGSAGAAEAQASPAFEELERTRAAVTEDLRELSASSGPAEQITAAHAVHAETIAVVARSAAADALIAARRADPATIAAARRHWYGIAPHADTTGQNGPATGFTGYLLASADQPSRLSGVAGATGVLMRHASVRSVWFANSLRGATALAVAVAVADLSGVQHGFWVALGTLSVLRTSAASTGATALRALGGTVVGFVVGGALLAAIGTGQTAMWAAFALAVLVSAYAPGTAPFLVGQAAFTIVIVLLFNLLAPVGWQVGLLRVEDVAIGCAVSLAVGVFFWPRGASALVGDDLADAFRGGARYLTQAVDWALSERMLPPEAAMVAVTAELRLEDALRGFLAEHGTKLIGQEDLWSLVTATQQLRLTAHTLAELRDVPTADGTMAPVACLPLDGSDSYTGTPACVSLRMAAAELADFYRQIASEVGHPGRAPRELVPAPPVLHPAGPGHAGPWPDGTGPDGSSGWPHPHLLWVQDHLHALSLSAQSVTEPALHIAESRRRPWWG